MENVDGYEFEVDRDGDRISIKFTDIFGDGEIFWFSIEDIKNIRDDLTIMLSMTPP